MTLVLTAKAKAEIIAIGQSRAPHEACGVLLAQPPPTVEPIVAEIPNKASTPETAYEFHATEAREVIDELARTGVVSPEQLQDLDVVVWHTHPSGRAGPSDADLAGRIPGVKYLVVTLDGAAQRY